MPVNSFHTRGGGCRDAFVAMSYSGWPTNVLSDTMVVGYLPVKILARDGLHTGRWHTPG